MDIRRRRRRWRRRSRCCSIKLSHSSSASCLSTTNHSGRRWTQAAGVEDMMAYTTLLMLGKLPHRKCP